MIDIFLRLSVFVSIYDVNLHIARLDVILCKCCIKYLINKVINIDSLFLHFYSMKLY